MIEFETNMMCDSMEAAELSPKNTREEFIKGLVEKLKEVDKHTNVYPKTFSKIFDTDYYWNVPYVIDIEKYKTFYGSTRLSDNKIKSLTFSCYFYSYSNGEINCVFDTFTNNQDEEGFDYDCYMKECTSDGDNFNNFIDFVEKITDCIIGVDEKELNNIINANNKNIEKLTTENNFLTQLV